MAREFKKSMSQKLRMDGRDYSRPGWYFLTLGADYHRHLFGRIEGIEMRMNALGALVEQCWCAIPDHYAHIELGAWQVMPNHFHGLIRIARPGGKGLGEVVNMFKGSVTREWRKTVGSRHGEKERHSRGDGPAKIWAPNYYDVICFDAKELAVRERYVRANPRRWALRDVSHGSWGCGFYRGNRAILKKELERRSLRISRRASEAEIVHDLSWIRGFQGVVFSTFFSPGERVGLDLLLRSEAYVVWVAPVGLPESVPVAWTEAFLEGRALWLSAFPSEQTESTRASCEEANRLVQRLSSGQ